MTNTANTPAEMLEANYALRVERQSIRRGAGGAGRHRGGDGVVRAYRVLAPRMLLTTCVERMRVPPYGMHGGAPGPAVSRDARARRRGLGATGQGESRAAGRRPRHAGELRRRGLRG